MVWRLLVRFSKPVDCTSVQFVPLPVALATWLQVVLALAAIVMSPAALSVKRGAKARCIAWAGSLQTNAQEASHMTNRLSKYRLMQRLRIGLEFTVHRKRRNYLAIKQLHSCDICPELKIVGKALVFGTWLRSWPRSGSVGRSRSSNRQPPPAVNIRI